MTPKPADPERIAILVSKGVRSLSEYVAALFLPAANVWVSQAGLSAVDEPEDQLGLASPRA